jgi:hypothetical protein
MTGGYTRLRESHDRRGRKRHASTGRPDLAISNASVGTITANQNGSFNVPANFTVTNLGTVAMQPNWNDYGYLSSGLFPLTHGSVGRLDASHDGAESERQLQREPDVLGHRGYPGAYMLFLRTESTGGGTADPLGNKVESNEKNNMVGVAVTLPTYRIWPSTMPPQAPSSSTRTGPSTSRQVSRSAIWARTRRWRAGAISAICPASGVLDASSTVLGSTLRSSSLAGGTSYNVSQTYSNITATPGNYTLFLKADGQGGTSQASSGVVAESSETNNAAA